MLIKKKSDKPKIKLDGILRNVSAEDRQPRVAKLRGAKPSPVDGFVQYISAAKRPQQRTNYSFEPQETHFIITNSTKIVSLDPPEDADF